MFGIVTIYSVASLPHQQLNPTPQKKLQQKAKIKKRHQVLIQRVSWS